MKPLAVVLVVASLSSSVLADERVPIAANFSSEETNLIAGLVVTDLLLYALQADITNNKLSLIGAPPAFDRELSQTLYRGPGAGRWLGGVPADVGLFIGPAAVFALYSSDALALKLSGSSFTGDANPDHHLLALIEAFGIAMGINQAVKVAVGRDRPKVFFDRPDAGARNSDSTLSFFSGHATSAFTLASFAHRNLADWLEARGSGPWLGSVLPGVVLYGGASVIGISRIVDQEHYLTDVLAGALVGAVVGNLVYSYHFDSHGRPRRRHPVFELLPLPGGMAISGRF